MTHLTLIIAANRLNYLNEALLSVMAQIECDFDILCISDLSGESKTKECFQEYIKYMKLPTKLICTHGNGTAGYVRNLGIEESKSNWIAYLDGDDFLHPKAMISMLNAINNCDEDVRLISSGMARIDKNGLIRNIRESLTYLPPKWIYDIDPDTIGHSTYFNQFQAIRKSAWTDYPFDETTNGEDIDFVLHHLLLGKFMKVSECLYYFRETPDSFSTKKFKNGDICTRRYKSGYYSSLRNKLYTSHVDSNFFTDLLNRKIT